MSYKPQTAGSIMTSAVPTCHENDQMHRVLGNLFKNKYESIHFVFVVDAEHRLKGYIDISALENDGDAMASEIMTKPPTMMRPGADQEKAVYHAIRDDVSSIPVVDSNGVFLGAITSKSLMDVMHDEHIEDALVTAGIRGKGMTGITQLSSRINLLVKARAPWLVIGLVGGLSLGFISTWFEESLKESIAIAYFIPVIAYVGGSVGAQASAIAVRALAIMKFDYLKYLYREFFTGIALGLIVGAVGLVGSYIIAGDAMVSVAVGLALIVASVIASVMASMIPFIFKLAGKDPALGSGPIATALLDVSSVLCYFLIASALVR